MASSEIRFKRSVSRDLRSLPQKDVHRILERISALKEDPRPLGSEKLSGREWYRIRQGNYRILYEVDDHQVTVVVVKVGHRREVYRKR
jgi:mRNA interferase RelE/StbE